MKKITLLSCLFLVSAFAWAQKPCDADPVYRQFDFWIGEWDAFATNGKLAGHSKISKILDNCCVLEEWTSAGSQQGLVFSGKSFNTYNSATGQWQQNWVDNTGGNTEYLTGHFENDAMHFVSRPFKNKNGITCIRRLTFFKLKEGKVRQFGEISNDDGKTWTPEFDLEYRAKKN